MIEMPIEWLSPTGEMVKCDTFEHITIAFLILLINIVLIIKILNPMKF